MRPPRFFRGPPPTSPMAKRHLVMLSPPCLRSLVWIAHPLGPADPEDWTGLGPFYKAVMRVLRQAYFTGFPAPPLLSTLPQSIFTHQPLNRHFSIFPPPHPPLYGRASAPVVPLLYFLFRQICGRPLPAACIPVRFRVQAAVVGNLGARGPELLSYGTTYCSRVYTVRDRYVQSR